MASTKELFRQLTKELRLIYKTDKLQEVPVYTFLENQFRRFQVTGEKECRGQNDVSHLASTYLCLLHSNRRLEELQVKFRGKGERSVEESARLVGLIPPSKPTDSK
ncbi:hypothetical protein ACOMHN_037848 [Nucella lapillus]